MALFRQYLELLMRAPGDRRRIALLLVLVSIAACFEALGVGLVMPFVALLQKPSLSRESPILRSVGDHLGIASETGMILFVGGSLLAVFVVKNLYLVTTVYVQMRFIYNRMTLLSRDLLSAYLSRRYVFFLQRNSTELVRNVVNDATAIFWSAIPSWFILIGEIVTCTVLALLLIVLEPIALPIVATAVGGGGYAFQRYYRRMSARLAEQMRENEASTLKHAGQAFGGIKEVRVRGSESFIISSFSNTSRDMAHAMRLQRTVQTLPRYAFETLAVAGLVLVASIVVLRGGATERLVALLGVMALAAVRVMPSAVRILAAVGDIRYYAPAITALHADLAAAEALPPEGEPIVFEKELRLADIGYAYPGATRASLENVSLTIARGESVALIGSSGAGKTTLADVLIGLLEPTSGRIEIDGEVLRPDMVRRWQRSIGYIPQQVFLTDDTIRRNIAFGVPDAEIDDKRLAWAVHAARLTTLMETLPDGLSTMVGERGARLSGGQRQRVGIARALYLNPKVLVLDEATSALDGFTEAEVVEAIEAASADRTTIVIAHRLSTVRKCDRLVYMSGGKIINAGSWDTLLASNAEFRKLVELAQHG